MAAAAGQPPMGGPRGSLAGRLRFPGSYFMWSPFLNSSPGADSNTWPLGCQAAPMVLPILTNRWPEAFFGVLFVMNFVFCKLRTFELDCGALSFYGDGASGHTVKLIHPWYFPFKKWKSRSRFLPSLVIGPEIIIIYFLRVCNLWFWCFKKSALHNSNITKSLNWTVYQIL